MRKLRKFLVGLLVVVVALAGIGWFLLRGHTAELPIEEVTGLEPTMAEPQAESIPTVNVAKAVGWPDDEVPNAADGLAVTRFADGLDHPRVIYTLPNGDVLVALTNRPEGKGPGGITGWVMRTLFERAGAGSPSADEIVLLRDADGDGAAEVRQLLSGDFESPSGLGWLDGTLYVAQHDALMAVPYDLGASSLGGEARKLMDLPAAGGHWMRNLIISPDGENIYVAVGSDSNIGERGMDIEEGRAAIWEYNLESGNSRIFAQGLRNANGLAYSPMNEALWTTVNERDMLGSDLVPDYMATVEVGAHYGWPWVYFKDNIDRRVEAPMPEFLTSYSRNPEYALGPHVAALGMVFSEEGNRMGEGFARGAFIARHGSWNRKPASGYDVVYVAFDERGNPEGKPVPVLTGFLGEDGDTAKGRPTWVDWAGDGALLVSDDTAGIIWRVIAPGAEPAAAIERFRTESLLPRRNLRNPRDTFSEEFLRREGALN